MVTLHWLQGCGVEPSPVSLGLSLQCCLSGQWLGTASSPALVTPAWHFDLESKAEHLLPQGWLADSAWGSWAATARPGGTVPRELGTGTMGSGEGLGLEDPAGCLPAGHLI